MAGSIGFAARNFPMHPDIPQLFVSLQEFFEIAHNLRYTPVC
jgi:hypothetical protein